MKKLIVIALLVAIVSGALYAQSLPGGAAGFAAWSSPQNVGSVGRFRTAADNFIRPDSFGGVNFDTFFWMMGYRNADDTNGIVHSGFATNVGNLYVAAYYGGNLWRGRRNFSYTEGTGTWLGEADRDITTVTLPTFTTGAASPHNMVSFLVGVADMGFRFTFYSNRQSFSQSNFIASNPALANGFTQISDFERQQGRLMGQLAWAYNVNLLGDRGLRPWVTFTLTGERNHSIVTPFIQDPGDPAVFTANSEFLVAGGTGNSISPAFTLALNSLNLWETDGGFRLAADLTYAFSTTLNRNSFEYQDAEGNNRISTGFRGTGGANIAETSLVTNTITPTFAGQWSDGPLALRFQLNLATAFISSSSTEMSRVLIPDTVDPAPGDGLVQNGVDSSTSTINFNPNLVLAAQWRPISRLTIVLGNRIDIAAASRTVTEGSTYIRGEEVANSSFRTVAVSNPMSFAHTLTTGVTFNATDNLSFEVASGARNGNINVFGDTNGLFNFTDLAVTLRF